MRHAVLPFVLLRDHRLKPSDKLVLLALQRWGWKTYECFPSDGTIATEAALSRRTVQLSLVNLASLGLIRVETDKSNPTGRKFVLVWMQDPSYLPPLKARKDGDNTKGPKPKAPAIDIDVFAELLTTAAREMLERGVSQEQAYDDLHEMISKATTDLDDVLSEQFWTIGEGIIADALK